MWKEKYETLERQFKKLLTDYEKLSGATMNPHLHPANGTGDDPGILQVTTEQKTLRTSVTKPEVEVRVKRRVIEMDGETVEGMIAILLSEGFFDDTKTGAAVVVELRRRGLSFGDATPYKRLGEIAGQGFLTREGKAAFRAVPGMKVNIVEA